MARSRKAKREQRRIQRQTISWAAKFHERYVVELVTDFFRTDESKIEKVFYCLAFMKQGRAFLQAFAGSTGQDKRILQQAPKRLATDGDIVIARLSGELFQPSPAHSILEGLASCKALERKINWWKENGRQRK